MPRSQSDIALAQLLEHIDRSLDPIIDRLCAEGIPAAVIAPVLLNRAMKLLNEHRGPKELRAIVEGLLADFPQPPAPPERRRS